MYISDKLLYIDLHKTGCTHIRRLLDECIKGERIGKHNRYPQLPTDKFIVGSVRNPWDWYVSLFAYGCSGQGALNRRLTKRFDSYYYQQGLRNEMVASSLPFFPLIKTLLSDISKPVAYCRDLYNDPNDVQNFRKWLKLMFSKENRISVGEGFAFSIVSDVAGLYTYRYLKLFIKDVNELFLGKKLTNTNALNEFDSLNNATDWMIKTENLEADFLAMLDAADIHITNHLRQVVLEKGGKKTNASKHLPSRDYYDQETNDLIAEKEALIIEKYNYSSPL